MEIFSLYIKEYLGYKERSKFLPWNEAPLFGNESSLNMSYYHTEPVICNHCPQPPPIGNRGMIFQKL